MGRILKPMVRGGGWYPSKKWIPLVKNGGYTTQNGGETEPVWATVSGAIASFTTPFAYPLKKLVAQIEPQQDLHGYDAPWAAGAGKNIVPPRTGTVTKTGITFTTDSDGVVAVSGTATATAAEWSDVFEVEAGVSYTLNGCPSGGGTSSYRLDLRDATNPNQLDQELQSYLDSGSGVSFTPSTTHNIRVGFRIANGYTVPSGIVFKPMVRLSSVSDATFAPYSNECPISGWTGLSGKRCGVNQWDEDWEVGGISSSTGENQNNNVQIRSKNYIPIKPNTEYFGCVVGQASYNFQPRFYDANKNYIGTGGTWAYNSAFTTPSNAHYFRFCMQTTYGTTYNNDISINYPSTDHNYHAYTSLPITCTWQTEAGTVYDGYIDVVSGVLTVDRAIFTENSSDGWRFTGDGVRAYKSFADIALIDSTSTVPEILTNYLTALSFYDLTSYRKTGITQAANSTNVSIRISSEVGDTTALNTYLSNNPLQIVYKLATPQTYQLTPQQISTLLGNNTVFVDTGDVSVTYQASIKGYIDKVLAS